MDLMLLRVLKPIKQRSSGHLHRRGDIVRSDVFKASDVPALLEACAVSVVHGPPLTELRAWKERAKKLEPLGVTTVVGFLLAEPEGLRDALGYKTLRSVLRLQAILMDVIRPDDEEKRG
jgi:hypothetical protein